MMLRVTPPVTTQGGAGSGRFLARAASRSYGSARLRAFEKGVANTGSSEDMECLRNDDVFVFTATLTALRLLSSKGAHHVTQRLQDSSTNHEPCKNGCNN